MAEDLKVKVVFRKLHFKRNLISTSSNGDLYFDVTVNGQPCGDKSVVTHIEPSGVITLSGFETIVEVNSLTQFDVVFNVMDQRNYVSDDDLGSMTYTLKWVWTQKEYTHSNSLWVLEWGVELLVDGKFGQHKAGEIFSARSGDGFMVVNTVGGLAAMSRLEFHPVRPVPPDAALPPRPVFPTGTAVPKLNKGGIPVINPGDDINIIPNPAVIPILNDSDASAATAAKIECTYYRPYLLNFTDTDERLTWTASSVSGSAAVKFIGKPQGLKVLVYGVTAGEILLEVKLAKETVASYRAIVGPVKKATCRFNICNGSVLTGANANTPRATPQNILDHLAIANRFLRQMAIELVLDSNITVSDNSGAVPVPNIPGIFRIRVSDDVTRNIALTGFPDCVAMNARAGVMNFAYIFSTALQDPTQPTNVILGAASDWPANPAGTTVTDSGTPSSSWKVHSGVKPDAAADSITMNIFDKRQRAKPAGVAGMYVTDANGDPSEINAQQTYGGTIAHEFGHNLTLRHRNSEDKGGQDGVRHPPGENVMHRNNATTIAQDFDILQAKAARQSPLVT